MRIIVLTDQQDRHYYFANRIISETGCVAGVITGGKAVHLHGRDQLMRRVRRKFPAYTMRNFVLNRLFRAAGRKLEQEKAAAETLEFGGARDYFERNHRDLRIAHVDNSHRSLNDRFFVELICSLRPDAIVVMGTCLIGKPIIAAAPLVLNLHTGLSPYYRGGYTNLFPFIEDDYGYFGVTVHKMSQGIDSGDIVASARPNLRLDDNYASINTRCIVSGTSLMVHAVRYAELRPLPAVPQWEKGKVFFARHFNNYVAHKYFKRKTGFIRRYIELQSRGRLSAVRTVSLPDVWQFDAKPS